MAEISVKLDPQQVAEAIGLFDSLKSGGRQFYYSAVSKTADTAKVRLGRLVRSELNLSKRDADKGVRLSGRPTPDKPQAKITISGRLNPLKRFGAKQLKRQGVVATTFLDAGRQTFAASFGPNIPRLGFNPFSRQEQKANVQFGPVSGRLPIHKLLGPSAADAVTRKPEDLEATVNEIQGVLQENLLSQVDRLLSRRKSER